MVDARSSVEKILPEAELEIDRFLNSEPRSETEHMKDACQLGYSTNYMCVAVECLSMLQLPIFSASLQVSAHIPNTFWQADVI